MIALHITYDAFGTGHNCEDWKLTVTRNENIPLIFHIACPHSKYVLYGFIFLRYLCI